MLKKLLIVLFAFLLVVPLRAQKKPYFWPRRQFAKEDIRQIKDTLQVCYGKNKTLPEKYELACLLALSFYPQLTETHISFEFNQIFTTMACRPRAGFLFRKRTQRRYLISINNKRRKTTSVLLREMNFNAQVGVIAHELAHVADYSQKSSARIIAFAVAYLFPKSRMKIEHRTDSIAVAHGAGWQLYDFSHFVLFQSKASPSYKSYKRKYYYTPKQIKALIERMPRVYSLQRFLIPPDFD